MSRQLPAGVTVYKGMRKWTGEVPDGILPEPRPTVDEAVGQVLAAEPAAQPEPATVSESDQEPVHEPEEAAEAPQDEVLP